MPQFYLNDSNAPKAYDALSDFAKGYIEALFFTNGDIGDESRCLNDVGVKRLTIASLADIARDCDKFCNDNARHLISARALVPGSRNFRHGKESLTDQRLGNLLWFARQGHGVTFTDDGDSVALQRLQGAARAMGETYIEYYRGWIHHA